MSYFNEVHTVVLQTAHNELKVDGKLRPKLIKFLPRVYSTV